MIEETTKYKTGDELAELEIIFNKIPRVIGTVCTDCGGNGADKVKTLAAWKTGNVSPPAYVRCWTCNGNGLKPHYPDYSKHRL